MATHRHPAGGLATARLADNGVGSSVARKVFRVGLHEASIGMQASDPTLGRVMRAGY